MQEADALKALAALAQPTRLKVLALLSGSATGIGSGDIAEAVGVPQNLMSAHLAVLSKAGLISSTKLGRAVVYRAEPTMVDALFSYLRAFRSSSHR